MEKEAKIQNQIVVWYNNTYCLSTMKPRCLILAIPNGGTRNPHEALVMKATGTLAGAADLLIIHQVGENSPTVAFVEVKGPQGRPSPQQIAFQARIKELGLIYSVVRSLDEFKLLISTL